MYIPKILSPLPLSSHNYSHYDTCLSNSVRVAVMGYVVSYRVTCSLHDGMSNKCFTEKISRTICVSKHNKMTTNAHPEYTVCHDMISSRGPAALRWKFKVKCEIKQRMRGGIIKLVCHCASTASPSPHSGYVKRNGTT